MQHSFPRRLAACFGVLLAVVMVSAPGEAPAPKAVFNDAQKAALDRVSAYLNGIHVLKSGFIQLAPDGQLDQGEFLLEKPGKLRFEYNAPNPTLIVATGGKFYVKNGRLNTVDSYDISDTPLGLLLSDNVDLKNNSAVTGIDIRPDELVLHARTFNNRQQQGVITMVFSNPGIELRQWTVKDNQGGTTDFALRNPEATPGPVDEALFDVPHKDPPPQGGIALMSVVGIVCDRQSHNDGSYSHRAGDEYVRAVRDGAGAEPLLIPASDPPPDTALLERLDGLLFSGAPSNVAAWRYGGEVLAPGTATDEARDATSLTLLAAAIGAGLPVFCICRGFQELNVALGGSLNPHVSSGALDHRENRAAPLSAQYAHAHSVAIMPGGLLAPLLGVKEMMVNSLHAQGIARLAPGLFVEARAPDGLIEAVSLPSAGGFVLGVQWHPEWHAADDPVSAALFSAFGQALDSRSRGYGENSSGKRKVI